MTTSPSAPGSAARAALNLVLLMCIALVSQVMTAFAYYFVVPVANFPNLSETPIRISGVAWAILAITCLTSFGLAAFLAARTTRPPFVWRLTWLVGACAVGLWMAAIVLFGLAALAWIPLVLE